jgi:hypothetical protein
MRLLSAARDGAAATQISDSVPARVRLDRFWQGVFDIVKTNQKGVCYQAFSAAGGPSKRLR